MAKAFTDAVDNLLGLIKQRRRWGNGALFSTVEWLNNTGKLLPCRCSRDETST